MSTTDYVYRGTEEVPRTNFKFEPVELPAETDPVDTPTAPAPVQAVQPESIVEHVQQIERFDSNIQERVWKLEKQGVRDPRISELAARIARLEQLVKPALADPKPKSEIQKIELEYISLTEQGKTKGLTADQYRCLPRVQRQKLLAGGSANA